MKTFNSLIKNVSDYLEEINAISNLVEKEFLLTINTEFYMTKKKLTLKALFLKFNIT
jgi:hypothetical protein